MKIQIKMTSDEPNYEGLDRTENIPFPAFLLTKKIKEETFDLMKIQLKQEVMDKVDQDTLEIDIDKPDEYQFRFKQGDYTRTVYAKME